MSDQVGKIVTLSECGCGLDHTGSCQQAIRKHYEDRIAELEARVNRLLPQCLCKFCGTTDSCESMYPFNWTEKRGNGWVTCGAKICADCHDSELDMAFFAKRELLFRQFDKPETLEDVHKDKER